MTSYEGILERDLLNSSTNHGALSRTALGAMDKVQSHDEDTVGSGSGSGFSDLSALENETDDFGRKLLQHQRDVKRLNNAVRGGQQAFRKARPNNRIAERVEREELERDSQAAHLQIHQRTSSGGSSQSDPPITVPREWGRKARKQKDWLKKITAPSENGDDEAVNADDDAIYPRRTMYTGDLDFRVSPNPNDDRLPTTEATHNTPTPTRRHRYDGTPSSLRHMNTTLKPLPDSDEGEQDFSTASLLASTPAPPTKRYARKIDEHARREIEELEQQAVTTRALDEIDQRAPNAVLRRTSSSVLRERAIADGMRAGQMSPVLPEGKAVSPSRIPRRVNRVGDKENVAPINGEAKGAEGLLGSRSSKAVSIKSSSRPGHERQDSLGLLKRLARVSSLSPSPARERDEGGAVEVRRQSQGEIEQRFLGLRNGRAIHKGVSPADATGLQSEDANDDRDGDYVHVEQDNIAQDIDATPMPHAEPTDAKTPVVTGAWIDTTLNTSAPTASPPTQPPHKTSDETLDSSLHLIKSEPMPPKSALAAIVRDAKSGNDTQQFGESTIQSLEEIVHPDIDPTDPTITFDYDPGKVVKEENLDDGRPLTQTERDRRQDILAFEGLSRRLRSARTNIKDASRGLRRVENKIENAQEDPTVSRQITVRPAGTVQVGHVHCEQCSGRGYQSAWLALWTELRSNFYTYNPHTKFPYSIRLTWLGLSCLLWWTWFLSESTLCSYYCHRRFAYRMKGYGVDPNAPVFPFVIPTLLFRPLRWFWKPLCEALAWAVGVAFHACFGDAFGRGEEVRFTPPRRVFDHRMPGATVRKAFTHTIGAFAESASAVGARVGRSVVDAVDEVGSMWDDEFLS